MEPERYARRRQERTACDTCRRRKTRCDLSTQNPCSVCTRVGLVCRTTEEGSLPKRRRTLGPQQQQQHQHRHEEPATARPASSTGTVEPPGSTGTVHSGAPELEVRSVESQRDQAAESMAMNGLSRFFRQGVDSTDVLVFSEAHLLRLVYVGTSVSNLAQLVQLKRIPSHSLHYPHPPLKPPLAWKPESIKCFSGSLDLADDAGYLPAQEVRDALVEAFFTKIHPGFPIIEESRFRSQYRDKTKPPPLLLLQAVLLAGAHVCDHPLVASSRMVVMRTIYRRASLLFHIRHENDRLHMIQAALLFTWHLEDADTVCGGSYYWLGIASRIAHGMGMHRDLSAGAISRLPLDERHLFRRVWWTFFQAEVFSCLEHGRPCTVSVAAIDQPPLEPQDFMEGGDGRINAKVEFEYCSRNAQLCFIALDVLNMSNPAAASATPASLSSIEAALAAFAFDLPSCHDFWSCQLQMHYNLVLLHLHRALSAGSDNAAAAQPSRDICSDASQAILACMETMCNRGWVGQCSFTSVSAVMAAAIQITNDAKAALAQGSSLLALSAQNRLVRLLECARDLAGYWPSAGALHGLFNELSTEVKHLARNLQTATAMPAADKESEMPANGGGGRSGNPCDLGLGWDPTFESFNFMMPTDFEVDAWMSNAGFLHSGLS